jgi:hypothetical protein
MPKLYEEEPSAILYNQLRPRITSFYKTFGDEAWTQQKPTRGGRNPKDLFIKTMKGKDNNTLNSLCCL